MQLIIGITFPRVSVSNLQKFVLPVYLLGPIHKQRIEQTNMEKVRMTKNAKDIGERIALKQEH